MIVEETAANFAVVMEAMEVMEENSCSGRTCALANMRACRKNARLTKFAHRKESIETLQSD
jgi:hypothetical protein